ncbi:MAG TPA: TIGR00282 family metallophosphoesterase [Vicinamibacteria bacterium]|nr:TIGR00282 family metallophosphoesterase [Vicinamibacteria bacterium]
MNVLMIGDVVGNPGRTILKKALPPVFKKFEIEYCVANVENAAGGFGVTKEVCDEILDAGVDCLTSGNHIWDKKEILGVVDLIPQLLRPLNYPARQPGRGSHVGSARRSGVSVATLNLSGRVFMHGAMDDPFELGRREAERLRAEAKVILVDMHGEATSEKTAIGNYLDGLVSAVVGTHTHVPTCDHRLLPGGTAYCTDLGMTGPYDSIIGVEKEAVIQRFLSGMPTRFETAKGDPRFAAAVIDVDAGTGRARAIERILLKEEDIHRL